MLLGFGGKNIFSFKEGFDVSFELDNNCPDDISQGKNISNILAVIGANASGKTNVLNTLSFINFFAVASFTLKPENNIPLRTFFNSKDNTELYVNFQLDKSKYNYEIEINSEKVVKEKLSVDNNIVFSRIEDSLSIESNDFSDMKGIKLRKNVSAINMAYQYEKKSITKIYNFFKNSITNLDFFGFINDYTDYRNISKLYYKNEEDFQFVKNIIKKIDTGIIDIEIIEDKDKATGETIYYPLFEFQNNEEIKFLTYFEQSNGTKALYKQLGAYKTILNIGGILILDEFDNNLHPDLLPILLELFESKKYNKNNAQFIFTTHHTHIVDNLKKYRVVIVNKEDSESFLYRVDEIEGKFIRNDRSIYKIYQKGKLGGKPNLKEFYG